RDHRIDLGRRFAGIELVRPCLNHLAVLAHGPLVPGERDAQFRHALLRGLVAVHRMSDEQPGPLELLQVGLVCFFPAAAEQTAGCHERGEDDWTQPLSVHENPSTPLEKVTILTCGTSCALTASSWSIRREPRVSSRRVNLGG